MPTWFAVLFLMIFAGCGVLVFFILLKVEEQISILSGYLRAIAEQAINTPASISDVRDAIIDLVEPQDPWDGNSR